MDLELRALRKGPVSSQSHFSLQHYTRLRLLKAMHAYAEASFARLLTRRVAVTWEVNMAYMSCVTTGRLCLELCRGKYGDAADISAADDLDGDESSVTLAGSEDEPAEPDDRHFQEQMAAGHAAAGDEDDNDSLYDSH